MKKAIALFCLTALIVASCLSPAFAEESDIDTQIAELEAQIAELQAQVDELKAEKAKNEYGDQLTGDELYIISDTTFDVYNGYDGSPRYDAIVEILNVSDKNLFLDNATFDLEDSTGHLIQSENYVNTAREVIKPGEKGYFYNQMGTEIEASADLNDLNFVPNVKVVEATGMPHEYAVSDLSLADDSFGDFKIVGRVMNDTDEEEYLYINAIFYDSEGKCIGITGTNVADMMPNNNTSFEISGMLMQENFDKANLSNYEIVAQETYYQW